ncbi:MAG: hypothetical protein OXU96_04265 [Gammaproteobacteria bacterium]|nr:hypothetical protein [Gammaproteobacteria bacterium]
MELGNGLAPASNVPAGDALQDETLIAPFTGKISTGRGCHLVQSQAPEVRARRRPFTEGIVSMSVRR